MPEVTQSTGSISEGKSAKPQRQRTPLEELLEASKDAERLISCFFDLNTIEGEPFQGIWDRLASAINRAHRVLQSDCMQLHEANDESALLRRPV